MIESYPNDVRFAGLTVRFGIRSRSKTHHDPTKEAHPGSYERRISGIIENTSQVLYKGVELTWHVFDTDGIRVAELRTFDADIEPGVSCHIGLSYEREHFEEGYKILLYKVGILTDKGVSTETRIKTLPPENVNITQEIL